MAPLDGSGGSEQDRDHRARYNMASYLWAPDSAHLLFDADGHLWLTICARHRCADRLYWNICRRRSEVFTGWFNRLVYPQSQSGRDPAARAGHACHMVAPAPNPSAANGQLMLNGEVDWV